MSKPLCKSEAHYKCPCCRTFDSSSKRYARRSRRRYHKNVAIMDGYTHQECPQCHAEIGFSEKTYANGQCLSCESQCPYCKGCEWVCENHPNKPWNGESNDVNACGCGAGMPCQSCDNADRRREIAMQQGS